MEIIQTTSIELEREEVEALKIIKTASEQCVFEDRFCCSSCPLSVEERCIGQLAELILKEVKEKNYD